MESILHLEKKPPASTTKIFEDPNTLDQNSSADFSSVMRAQLTGQEVRLQALRVRVDHAKAQADLLYLSGESS